MNHTVKIRSISPVTRDVLCIVTDKPQLYSFTPGQATDVAINKPKWANEFRPFTFTCLPENEYLEFTTKTYPSHNGVTNQLLQLKPGDELILQDPFGTIAYQGEGMFIAGGAGVTPFISILRHLSSQKELGNNKLLFANKTKADIILESEFQQMLGNNFINILSAETDSGYESGHITKEFIRKNISGLNKWFYVCGPPPMMEAIEKQLKELGVDPGSIITEAV
jgi:ferredoxin-NADP reductase